MRKWLSRLTFSFLIIAGACGFEAFEGFAGRRPARVAWQHIAFAVAAAGAFIFFLAAVRIRRTPNDPRD